MDLKLLIKKLKATIKIGNFYDKLCHSRQTVRYYSNSKNIKSPEASKIIEAAKLVRNELDDIIKKAEISHKK